jgi:hypothetical protein
MQPWLSQSLSDRFVLHIGSMLRGLDNVLRAENLAVLGLDSAFAAML